MKELMDEFSLLTEEAHDFEKNIIGDWKKII